ncbi:MAG: peptide chain release factor 2 [bacterium]|nr:peptide chain release factor 2 [bacterium]
MGLKERLDEISIRLIKLKTAFEVAKVRGEISRLEKEVTNPHLWEDKNRAKGIIKKLNSLKERIEPFARLNSKFNELKELFELAKEDEKDALAEIEHDINSLNQDLERLEIEKLFSKKFDKDNAILSIHPGAGGVEAADWAGMLLRMYLRFCEEKGFQTEIVDMLPGEEAGIKSATLIIKGPYAYGYLNGESGVHRLVRISPFDAGKRRHTSFASISIIPEIEDKEFELKREDLHIDTFRASGPGGQHVNVTDSAVRITHLPTKITVQCQSDRSQIRNKENALKVLKARVFQFYQKKRKGEIEKVVGEKKEIGWGSQIRSYVFHPYTKIRDHRTGVEIGDGQRVLDGFLEPFIDAYLRKQMAEKSDF